MKFGLPTGIFGMDIDALLAESATLTDKRGQAVADITMASTQLRNEEDKHATQLAHAVRRGGVNPDDSNIVAQREAIEALKTRVEAIDTAQNVIQSEIETIFQHAGSEIASTIGKVAEDARSECLELTEKLSKAEQALALGTQAYSHCVRQIDSPDELIPWNFIPPALNIAGLQRTSSDWVPAQRLRDLLATAFEQPALTGSLELRAVAADAGCRCLEIRVDQRKTCMVDGLERQLTEAGLTRITYVKKTGLVEAFVATSSIERDGPEKFVQELAPAAELIFKTKKGNKPTTSDPQTLQILSASKPTRSDAEVEDVKREVQARTQAIREPQDPQAHLERERAEQRRELANA